MSNTQRAIIIGAGVAGLAAAVRLGEGGRYQPLVLEQDATAGGLAKSHHYKGFVTDYGPHRIHTELPEVDRLISAVAAPSLMTVNRASRIYLRNHYLTYPPAPLDMLRRLGLWQMSKFMAGFAGEVIRSAPAEETYESLMCRAFGRPLYEFLLKPYSEKTWKINPAELHADTARVRVSAGSLARMITRLFKREAKGAETSLKQFRYVKGGIENLVRHLRETAERHGAQLELGHEVLRLELNDQRRVTGVKTISPGAADAPSPYAPPGSPELFPGEVFLSSAPLPKLLDKLLPHEPFLGDARKAATGLRYMSIIFVGLIVNRDKISNDNWLYFPEPHLVFNRAYEAKNFDESLAPSGQSLLCVEITCRPGDPIEQESEQALASLVIGQMAATGLFRKDEVTESFSWRIPYAYPVYTLDYAERLDTVLAGLRQVPNLMTLGRQGLFNHNNMDHSIGMGLRAADLLNAMPAADAVQTWYETAGIWKKMRIVD